MFSSLYRTYQAVASAPESVFNLSIQIFRLLQLPMVPKRKKENFFKLKFFLLFLANNKVVHLCIYLNTNFHFKAASKTRTQACLDLF